MARSCRDFGRGAWGAAVGPGTEQLCEFVFPEVLVGSTTGKAAAPGLLQNLSLEGSSLSTCMCGAVRYGSVCACARGAVHLSPLSWDLSTKDHPGDCQKGTCQAGLRPASHGLCWETGTGNTRATSVIPRNHCRLGLGPNLDIFDVLCLYILGKSRGSALKRKGLKGH